MKARAMVLEEFNKPLVLREIDIPEIPKNGLLIRIISSGICGSDLYMIEGKDIRTPLPIILGHEGVGEVIEINGEKKDLNGEILKKGDLIIWNRGIVCGECFYCKVLKESSLCPYRKIYGINRSSAEYPYLLGAFSEYMILEEKTEIIKLPKDVDPSIMALAGCSGATAVHAFDSLNNNLLGKTIVIQGGGPLGMFSCALARYLGAENVILISGSSKRLDIARKIGVDLVIDRNEFSMQERRQKIRDITYGRGADIVIEATGNSSAILEGIDLLRKGGIYLIVGVSTPQEKIPIDVYEIASKNLTLQGIWVSEGNHLYKAVSFISKNKDLFSLFVTHRLPLKRVNDALELMRKKEALKVVLENDWE
ncbi:MAG: zinc-binding dehydrogenase [Dictyoglomaceae bacterium]